MGKIFIKIRKLLLQPIYVYCFHHVCSKYDKDSMNKSDWMLIDDFKNNISCLYSEGYEFISLSDAYKHISRDIFRCKRYVVITFDDGYASLKEILPWLQENKIPVTLFINGKYLDNLSYRDTPKEKYLNKDELFSFDGPLIEIGNHGWEHKDSCKMASYEFECSVLKNIEILSHHPRYVPFWAYTWGKHNAQTDEVLQQHGLIPVLVDGNHNYNDCQCVHRLVL